MLIQETNMFFRINKLLFCVKLQLVTAISDVKKKKKKKNRSPLHQIQKETWV